MRNYEQKISEMGSSKEKLSKGLQKSIREYVKAEKEYDELRNDLSNMSEEDETRADVEREVAEYEELLNEEDEKLTRKVLIYFKNKDTYEANTKRMRDNNPQFQQAKQKAEVTQQLESVNTLVSEGGENSVYNPEPQEVIQQQAEPISVQAEVVAEEKEEGFGSWILWGGLAVLGLMVGINVMKNKS